jgi:methyl-accepting chemotaxis protein
MNWTIGKKVTATGIAVLVLSVGTAGLGLKMNADLGDALDRATVSASILRNHMQADMMHDALRSDVFGALLSSDPANGVDPAEMKAGLKEHRETFEAAVAENTRLATDPTVSPRRATASPIDPRPTTTASVVPSRRRNGSDAGITIAAPTLNSP